MAQPQWVTPAGNLGVIPEGIFYRVPVQATAGNENVYFKLIAGELPEGVQVNINGFIEGVPHSIIHIQGVPQQVARDVTSTFAIRAYTQKVVNGVIVVDRLADRTFSLTVTGQDVPEFITPPGNIGTYYDGSEVSIQLQYTDVDPGDNVTIKVLTGELPPGLILDPHTGLISGIIKPLTGTPGTAVAGFDATEYAEYPWDFATRSASKNYQFSLIISDGKGSNVQTFEIYVYSKDSMSADTTDFTADNTFITADVVPARTPVLVTPAQDLGRVRADNFYAFKFDAIDFDGDPVEFSITTGAGIGFDPLPRSDSYNFDPGSYDYDGEGFDRGTFALPPGLQIDSDTGWFYGYIPDQGATEYTYRFAVRVRKLNEPTLISDFTYFTITITGDVETEVIWLTPQDLGTINNGAISTLAVEAINTGGRSLSYRLESGSNSRLPQGLTLQPSGHITGRVAFNTFALDGGSTTFDTNLNTRLGIDETTFDTKFEFTVNAFAAQSKQIGYQLGSIVITNGGSGYVSQPTVTISAPPDTADSIQATAGIATIVNGVITDIAVGNPGRGYTSAPTITITGGGGADATAVSTITESTLINSVSVLRRFTVVVNRVFQKPYETLYIKCMPPEADRALINQLIQNQDIIPESVVYRADDPNFGVAKSVIYNHAFGLNSSNIEDYVASLDINHYWKNLTLGAINTAQALDSNGNVLYEVVYSKVVDDLVNNAGESVAKSVDTPYPVVLDDATTVDVVYPNSLVNMRDQVIDTVGQLSPALPLWMTSKQADGRVLGFTPAWVIAYVKPGQSGYVAYNIRTRYGDQLNKVDYKVDRYELDRSQTYNWDPDTAQWQPQPPAATTFDTYSQSPTIVGWVNNSTLSVLWDNNGNDVIFWSTPPSGIPQTGTIFDGNSTRFITPPDRWVDTDEFNEYLVFPRINILE